MSNEGPQDPNNPDDGLTPEQRRLKQLHKTTQDRVVRLGKHLKHQGHKLVKNPTEIGGALGKIKHKASYDEIGIAFEMLFTELIFIMQIMFNIPLHLEEQVYENLPDDLKIDLDNYDPDVTPIYRHRVFAGEVYLDYESGPILDPSEITYLDVLANGYFLKPTLKNALRHHLDQFNKDMMGCSWDPNLEAIANHIKGEDKSPFKRSATDPNIHDNNLAAGNRNRP